MSKQAVHTFLDSVEQEDALFDRIRGALAETDDQESATLSIARELGLEFTADEFAEVLQERYGAPSEELTDAELETVAGGMFPASTKPGGVSLGFPDVCKMPSLGVPVPTPYPNMGTSADAGSTPTKTKIESKPLTDTKSR